MSTADYAFNFVQLRKFVEMCNKGMYRYKSAFHMNECIMSRALLPNVGIISALSIAP